MLLNSEKLTLCSKNKLKTKKEIYLQNKKKTINSNEKF
jgi:hypothetical protein